MIKLHYSNGKAFVWNAKDVLTLREEHHILGNLVGCYPFKSFQTSTKWLPQQLMPEEVTLLIEKGIAQLISVPNVTDSNQIELFYEMRNKLCDEQAVLFKENRKKEIIEKANLIYEGKKRKFMEKLKSKKKAKENTQETAMEENNESEDTKMNKDTVPQEDESINSDSKDAAIISEENTRELSGEKISPESEEFHLDKNDIIEAELSKVPDVSRDCCLVQLFTESPWKSCPNIVTNWKYPSSEIEKVRYAVFKDLWEKKYFITPGSKFGGDFLAYEGDPLKFHATFIVVCKYSGDRFYGSDVVVYARLAQRVKKTFAFASLNTNGGVDYITVNWEHKMV